MKFDYTLYPGRKLAEKIEYENISYNKMVEDIYGFGTELFLR